MRSPFVVRGLGSPVASSQSSRWTPSKAYGLAPGLIIEDADPGTHRAFGALPSVGEVVDAWSTKGPAGQIQLTSIGACTRQERNGIPYLLFPASGDDDLFRNATPLDLIDAEVWLLLRMDAGTGKAGLFGEDVAFGDRLFVTLDNGDIDAVGPEGSFLRSNSGAVPTDTWFTARLRSSATHATLWIDGVQIKDDAHSFTDFIFELLGGIRESVTTFPFKGAFHSFLTVLGSADAELEANLYSYLGALRDQLNGV